jgi:hypothetical protein
VKCIIPGDVFAVVAYGAIQEVRSHDEASDSGKEFIDVYEPYGAQEEFALW